MSLTKSTGFWAWVGKIGALVALVWGLIRIGTALLPAKEYDVRATGYCSSITLPDSLLASVPSSVRYDLDRLESVWWITVRNEGTKEVQDLSIVLPFDGLYETEQVGATSVFTSFQRIINIGSLRPSHEVNVTVWASPAYFPLHTWCTEQIYKETKITHPNGVVGIRYTEKVKGVLGWFVRTNRALRGALPVLAIGIPIIVLIPILILVFGKSPDSSEVDNGSPEVPRENQSGETECKEEKEEKV